MLTTSVWESFSAFCDAEGLDRGEVRRLFRDDPEALALLRRLEVGELDEDEFSARSARCWACRRTARADWSTGCSPGCSPSRR